MGRSAIVQRGGALVAAATIATAVGLAFGRIFTGRTPTYELIAIGVASGTIAWATERRGMSSATAASALGLVLAPSLRECDPTCHDATASEKNNTACKSAKDRKNRDGFNIGVLLTEPICEEGDLLRDQTNLVRLSGQAVAAIFDPIRQDQGKAANRNGWNIAIAGAKKVGSASSCIRFPKTKK